MLKREMIKRSCFKDQVASVYVVQVSALHGRGSKGGGGGGHISPFFLLLRTPGRYGWDRDLCTEDRHSLELRGQAKRLSLFSICIASKYYFFSESGAFPLWVHIKIKSGTLKNTDV